ncbi:hypothetical protein Tco_1570746 [Tanacetum coccineum]
MTGSTGIESVDQIASILSTIVFGKLSAINGFVDSLPVVVYSGIANSFLLFRHAVRGSIPLGNRFLLQRQGSETVWDSATGSAGGVQSVDESLCSAGGELADLRFQPVGTISELGFSGKCSLMMVQPKKGSAPLRGSEALDQRVPRV